MEINSTLTFERNYEELFNGTKRFLVNQGSSRSGKTFGLCQLIIVYCLTNAHKKISIVRKTSPTLKSTVMLDFFNIMKELGIYSKDNHNKTDQTYEFPNGTVVSYFSADDEQKLRGRSHDIVWANEANELYFDDYFQINIRTTDRIIVDYNPSESDSWIYNLPEEDVAFIKSTYLDNPFLAPAIIKELEQLKETDEQLYQIYALGERTTSRKNIYNTWEFVDSKPDYMVDFVYGLDFGYNHPMSLIRVWYYENELFVESVIYESFLTVETDLIPKMEALGIEKGKVILADHARPDHIESLRRAGFWTEEADKAVKKGIDTVKTFKVSAREKDEPIKKEYANYMWKKQGDRILDEPVKLWDDAMDSIRYATMYIKKNFAAGGNQFISYYAGSKQ